MKTSEANLARKPPVCQAGDRGHIFIRRGGWRPCTVLAVLADRAVVEYVRTDPVRLRPSYTALAYIDAARLWPEPHPSRVELAHPHGRLDRGPQHRYLLIAGRPATYLHLPLVWLQAIVNQSGTWVGTSSAGIMPTPEKLMWNILEAQEDRRVIRIQGRQGGS